MVMFMNILPPLQTGNSGISRGFENLQEVATDIAKAGISDTNGAHTVDLTQSAVELKQQEQATLAAVKVVGETDQTLGTLLDVKV